MDAHVFRRVAESIGKLLVGGRLEKIQEPAPSVYVFSFYAQQAKRHLVLRYGRQHPFLFLADERPVAGQTPSASVMRLRKYCAGRRIAAWGMDWTARVLYFLFQAPADTTGGSQPEQTWLALDMREGPQLLHGSEPPLGENILWPDVAQLEGACAAWREWPVLTPALRRTLAQLDPLDAAALLLDLEAGGGDIFVYTKDNAEPVFSAWPMPAALVQGRQEQTFDDPLEAVRRFGAGMVLAQVADKAQAQAAAPYIRETSRLQRLLAKVDAEQTRLQDMCALQEKGLALQAILWRHAPDARYGCVKTDSPAYPEITLDERYTLRENMQMLFHKATRGRRGLVHVAARRQQLEVQLRTTMQMAQCAAQGAPVPAAATAKSVRDTVTPRWPKGIQAFRSSDGFVILRGRDAKGNATVLRMAAGHDVWLHIDGGPSAHAVIRRNFTGQEIPRTTLEEAGCLVAVKSWQKDSPTAHVLCAQVRHVRPLKGAGVGTVRIEKVQSSFTVTPDMTIEDRLRYL